ncbi:MAG: DUF1361 domain-containing protein [bacterium]
MTYSKFSLDYFFQQDNSWISQLTVNGYPLAALIWNLFLFLIPWLLCNSLFKYWKKTKFKKWHNKIIAIAIAFVWLLFLPNTAYVITEIRHIAGACPIASFHNVCLDSAWMIIFLFTYGILGWIAFVYLIKQMHSLIAKIWNNRIAFIYLIIIIPITALGVLLGLLDRWNSWELLTTPLPLFKTLLLYITDPVYFLNWLIFSGFLYILYWIGQAVFKDIKKISKPFE